MHFQRRGLELAMCLALAFSIFGAAAAVAQDEPATIPYQGQLADHEGRPVDRPSGVAIVFRIYSAPVGGTARWSETHENVSVVGGRFSVMLGSRTPFSDLTMLKRTVYLGVTVDDGDLATADVEMRPRQAIVPVIAAVYATQADHAKQALRAHNANTEIPIGGITMYYGKEENLPENWRICNGRIVNDPESIYHKMNLPDLRNKFVRGWKYTAEEDGERRFAPLPSLEVKGSHRVYAHDHKIGNRITAVTSNVVSEGYWSHGIPTKRMPTIASDPYLSDYESLVVRVEDRASHNHAVSAYMSGKTYKSGVYDNQPLHVALHYIIRIK